jgi:hypothetical protein
MELKSLSDNLDANCSLISAKSISSTLFLLSPKIISRTVWLPSCTEMAEMNITFSSTGKNDATLCNTLSEIDLVPISDPRLILLTLRWQLAYLLELLRGLAGLLLTLSSLMVLSCWHRTFFALF